MNSPEMNHLLPSLARLAQLQHESIDRLALQEAVAAALGEKALGAPDAEQAPQEQLQTVTQHLQVAAPRWLKGPDASKMPALVHAQDANQGHGQWGVLRGQNAQGLWISDWWDAANQRWDECADAKLDRHTIATLRLTRPYSATNSPVAQLIRHELLANASVLRETLLGSMMINVLALVISFYSLQVYDRVIPAAASQTLLVLTLGVVGAIMFEWLAKRVRSRLYERLIDQVDQRLARQVYMRFLAIRLDQLPQSVGALSAQIRGYESVRGFFTTATSSLLVDAPFALLFLVVMAMIGGWLAVIPLLFFMVCLSVGMYYRRRVDVLAAQANAASNQKTGLLVETVEGAESIKSGQGGWRMLSRWMKTTDEARDSDLQIRNVSEHSQHLASSLQQVSYTLLVATGALMVSRGELSLGGLIACSILSGRVLSPVSMIPGQLVQWAHAKAALQGLDRLWALQDDHHGQEMPILPAKIKGAFRFEGVLASYGGKKALAVSNLVIQPGEKIGVLGPIGAGKTTLLRLLSGMYKPQEGRILLDDVDLSHLSKPLLAEHLGYVQQEGRLFAGTLRDNLILGQLDPGDEAILQAARETGLLQTVITVHPKGLQQEIFEGGTGLSGGQRQLVNLTRAFLRRPRIWLLDEPTASMDRGLEQQVMHALKAAIGPSDTLVLVTHKAEMLELTDRLMVVANHQVVMDGPKAQVLERLQTPPPQQRAQQAAQQAAQQRGFASITMLLVAAFIGFLLWAALFEIEQTVRAQGQIIPTARTQVIQSADGGVLEKLLVEEGQSVKAGQELAILERERSQASYDESRAKAVALSVALARTQAEALGRAPEFGPALRTDPKIVAVQQDLYEQRKRSLQDELTSLQQGLDMALEELRMNEALLKNGDTSRLEVMRAKRQTVEIEAKINATRNKYLQDARAEATKLAEDLAAMAYKLDERRSVLGHTVLTAPIAGVVKYLKVTTIGGVLRAGDEMMQISPTEGGMVFEVKINPVDIGQLQLGLPVAIKLDAFDYSVYGNLEGTLVYLSSDTLVEQAANGQSNSYYRAHVNLDADKARSHPNPMLAAVVLKPGMTATVDIRTGQRSVLKYLAKPIYKAFGGAMNER
ncbi:ATP-binding cassette domain-containing protein [Limnohabitans sp. Rim8]|uniref:ATP-binding cassette domain-containing protein n=1 Tax=Limnohabitans sp. Rim8 TaxID=1100718 RepID=UPI002600D6CE|nr:ATP-binding cassette domain-containing protein [Limnohabitans sp. Rim8]